MNTCSLFFPVSYYPSHATCFLKPLEILNVKNLFCITDVHILYVSTIISHLQVTLKLLMKLLFFHPQVQFLGYALICVLCPAVIGSSSYCLCTVMTATHNTMGRTTHHQRIHGSTDEGIPQKLNLWAEAQQFHQF
jgi:hypothetical protein